MSNAQPFIPGVRLPSFVQDLKKPVFTTKPSFYGHRMKKDGEIDAHGIYLANTFCDDPDNLLETVYKDFAVFTRVYGIGGTTYPVTLKKGPAPCFEAYEITVTAMGVTITANDTEGIRRGVIYLEDELRRKENAYLTPGTVTRRPYMRSRITRSFFAPTNRPPHIMDELDSDFDYYPDEYLNRLMHDGSNGVWVYARFYDLLPSKLIPEYGHHCKGRLEKLNALVQKCRRYGIGVYVFAIEPAALPPEIALRHPEMSGATTHEPLSATQTFANQFPELYDPTLPRRGKAVCLGTKAGRDYCYEAGYNLVSLVPGLRGFISITYGERDTSCVSVVGGHCTRCSGKTRGTLLAEALEAMRSGMRDANPDFEFISWTYGHRLWSDDEIREYVRKAPDDVMLMQNFGDRGYEEQLGRERLSIDYWLSYVGPAQMFITTAREANEHHKHLYAKMQVCCSHEISSVPYVPVPGLVFRKYAKAREYQVEGVLQCWYTGNYPCIMSKAAGELAFMDDFSDEEGFLNRLAALTFGESRAAAVTKVWQHFANGYSRYPLNIMFSYYGPAHNGVVWDLALKPKNKPLPRSWQTDPVDGDRIYDALMSGHTLDEAITLLALVCKDWHEGAVLFKQIADNDPDEKEQLSVAQAIDILFESTYTILKFYQLRDRLGRRDDNPSALLADMKDLVQKEIRHSEKMLPLCDEDNRLGYHSEAEDFKFTKDMLEKRIRSLKNLLATEFAEVENRIEQGLSPLSYYDGQDGTDGVKHYALRTVPLETASWDVIDKETNSRFRMAKDERNLYIELSCAKQSFYDLSIEYTPFTPTPDIHISENGRLEISLFEELYWSLIGKQKEDFIKTYSDIKVIPGVGSHFVLTVALDRVGWKANRPMKIRIAANGVSWCNPISRFKPTLGKDRLIPDQFGWIMPTK